MLVKNVDDYREDTPRAIVINLHVKPSMSSASDLLDVNAHKKVQCSANKILQSS